MTDAQHDRVWYAGWRWYSWHLRLRRMTFHLGGQGVFQGHELHFGPLVIARPRRDVLEEIRIGWRPVPPGTRLG